MHPDSNPNYLKYKFVDSAWALPFWASLIGFIASKLPIPIPGWARIRRPLGKIAAPALIVSTIGALALPGTSPDYPNSATTSTKDVGIGRRSTTLVSPPPNVMYAGAY
jgi:hypothetical protein